MRSLLAGLRGSALRGRLHAGRCSGLRCGGTLASAAPTAPLASSPAVARGMVRSTVHIFQASLVSYFAPKTCGRAGFRRACHGSGWSFRFFVIAAKLLGFSAAPRDQIELLNPEGYPILLNAPLNGQAETQFRLWIFGLIILPMRRPTLMEMHVLRSGSRRISIPRQINRFPSALANRPLAGGWQWWAL